MNSHRLCLLLLTGTLSLLPLSLTAQLMPGSKKLSFCDSSYADGPWRCTAGRVTALADGSFAVSSSGRYNHQGRGWMSFAQVEIVDASGKPRRDLWGSRKWFPSYAGAPAVARYGPNGMVVAWHEVARARSDVLIEWLSGSALASESRKGLCNVPTQIASNGAGQVAVVWLELACGAYVPTSIGVRAFGPDQLPATPVLHIGPSRPGAILGEQPKVWIDAQGLFLVVWTERTAQPVAVALRGQRFDSNGQLLGPPFDFGTGGSPATYSILPNGEVAVVWRLKPPAPAGEIVWLQRHSGEGEPIGPPQADLGLASGAALVAIAGDFRNNLVLLWQAGGIMRARLFNRDLVPQGAPFELGFASPFGMVIALADTGRLLHVSTDDDEWIPVGRLRRVRHEADACVRRGGLFLCDTANDGFDAEAEITFGNGSAHETPFFADWDGDGRADPCLYRNGRFFCDTGHDGGTGARSPLVGTAGDIPLLGDLNGDGRADPCVQRGAAILCDLARDGGSKDLRISLGFTAAEAILGDPNGDGRDDPCLLHAGRLLCDTAHNGAELMLDLRPLDVQGPILFGDVNGDGRDEACRFTGDRFVCGVYSEYGGVPAETIEIVFGQPGDIPLLGDLDAF